MDIYSDKNTVELVTVAAEFCAFVEKARKFTKKDFLLKLHKLLPLVYLKTALLGTLDEDSFEEGFVEAYISEYEYEYVKKGVSITLGSEDKFINIFNIDSSDLEQEQQEASGVLTDIYHNLKNFVENYRSLSEQSAQASRQELINDFKMSWGQKLLSLLNYLHHLVYFSFLEDIDEENEDSFEEENSQKTFYNNFIDNYHKKI